VQNYDETEVKRWADEIETVLDAELECGAAAQQSLDDVRRHYEAGVEKWEDHGLSEEACYEFEVAYNLLDRFRQDVHLNVESEQYDF